MKLSQWILSLLTIILNIACTPSVSAYKNITFTAEENAWIKEHQHIRLGFTPHFEPILIQKQDGLLSGILIDFFDEINQRTGLNIHIVAGDFIQIFEKAKQKNIDGIAVCNPELADEAALLKSQSHIHAFPAIFAHQDTSYHDRESIIGKRVCYPKGSRFGEFILKDYRDKIQLIITESELESLRRVYNGHADYAIGFSINDYIVSKYHLSGVTPVDVFWDNRVDGVSAIRSDWPIFVNILNKAIESYSEPEMNALIAKWVTGSSPKKNVISFSSEEEAWISNHPVITLAVDNTYPPLNFEDEEGKITGLSVDYINAFIKKAGLKVNYKGSIWSIAIKRALAHEVDGVVNADVTEERKAHLNFTVPYIALPTGIITEKGALELKSITDLSGKTVCAKSNSSHLELLKKKTKAEIIPIETLEQGLEKVIKGEVFGVFDDVTVLGHLIAKYNFANLKINLIHYDDVVGASRLGLRNDDPVMLSVLNKAILSLTKKEKGNIQNRWLSLVKEKTVIEKQFDWILFIKIVAPLFALFIIAYLLLMFHNKRLKLAVDNRTHDLKKSREQFRILIDHAADAVLVHDFQGHILMVNQQACNTLRYSSAELLKMSIFEIETESMGVDEMQMCWNSLTQGQPITLEGRHKRKDGTAFPVELRLGVIEHEEQKSILALVRDVTYRKKIAEEKRTLEAQLRQAYKMEAIGTLAGGIAHDFNNILSPIIGYAELLEDSLPPDSIALKQQQQIVKAGLRAKELAQQILLFSRQADYEMKPVQPHLIIKEALKLLRSSIPATIEIRENISSNCGSILADMTQMHQIVMNVCTNAYHAMRESGGILGISLSEIEITQEDISFEKLQLDPGEHIKLEISDTGHGMTQTTMDKIFDPYFTTKPKGEGTGLGLSIVLGIVKGFRGQIKIYSESGEGTSVNIYFPRLESEVDTLDLLKEVPIPTGNERILLVDDEKAILDMTKTLLDTLGYEVSEFISSQEALVAFQVEPNKFDLVIADMTMPHMTGLEMIKQMFAIRPNMPVILCTGFSALITQEKAHALGIKGFLTKPILKKEMSKTIREVLNNKF